MLWQPMVFAQRGRNTLPSKPPTGSGRRSAAAQPAASAQPTRRSRAAAETERDSGRNPERDSSDGSGSHAASASEPAARIIKKYPNRRLYDTSASAYITLADVRQLVMKRTAFVVRDAKSGEDLTRSILLQIILEEESGGEPMFTEDLLANIIRFYGNAMQGAMGQYLEKNFQTFMELQAKLSEQSKGLNPQLWTQFISSQSPIIQGMMGSYMEQSKTLFSQMQEQLQKQGEQMLASMRVNR
jgi:polyhydroxyalkanoate synthesis repressor PhaR